MEDFGLLKGTQFDFGKEWTKKGESGPGSLEDCLTEATMETYMNKNGLRYKMNKTDKEREGLKLFGGLLPEVKFTVPGLNVDVNIVAPQVESVWEAFGFTARGGTEGGPGETPAMESRFSKSGFMPVESDVKDDAADDL